MKRYGLWLATFWIAITAVAQTTPENLSRTIKSERVEILVNEKHERIFAADEYDSLVFLPEYGLKVYVKNQNSIDFLNATYKILEQEVGPAPTDTQNANKNINLYGKRKYAWRLEYPHTRDDHENANSIISVHERPEPEGVTFSLEWDCKLKSQRWTCYQFHNGIKDNKVERGTKWNDDPNIPEQYRTHTKDYEGMGDIYHRGHMCNSLDRRHSEAQNEQTFFISNAHPQFYQHNTGVWKSLEARVNKWGMNPAFRDTLYVVKAGTIDEGRVLTPMKSSRPGTQEVLVPEFMYMAILCRKGKNDYKAIAFWTKHDTEPLDKRPLRSFAISVEELEQKTGIDFFCNLPDDIEERVEKEFNPDAWEW